MHDAIEIGVVMVETEGVAELVDGCLRRAFQEFLGPIAPEPGDRDYREPISDRGMAEHKIQPVIEQVDVRHGKDAVTLLGRHGLLELGREILGLAIPIPADEGVRHRLRRGDGHLGHVVQFFAKMLEHLWIDASEGLDREVHPFTTPRGTIRATILVRPAPSATRTTSSTFLYAPGASSTIPARDAALR